MGGTEWRILYGFRCTHCGARPGDRTNDRRQFVSRRRSSWPVNSGSESAVSRGGSNGEKRSGRPGPRSG